MYPKASVWTTAALAAAWTLWPCRGVAVSPVGAQAPAAVVVPAASAAPDFAAWLSELRAEALARGIRQTTVDAALGSLDRLPVVVERDRSQAELTLSLDRYLARRLPARFVRSAKQTARTHQAVLRRAEAMFGVPRQIVAAIWGLESNFGRFTGIRPTIPALATLAHDGRRAELFRKELFDALAIVDAGDVPLDQLRGSWAGAMGQPQFMPSTFRTDAVDFDGDGRRDIWTSTPDVVGSIAHYLQRRGWKAGERWGREVMVSATAADRVATIPLRMTGACRAVRDMSEPRPLTEWARLGVTLPGRRPLPRASMEASLVRVDRRVFLVYPNYETLLAYNCAHTYALSVAILADRLP